MKKSTKYIMITVSAFVIIGFFANLATENDFRKNKAKIITDMEAAYNSKDYEKVVAIGDQYSSINDYDFKNYFDAAKIILNQIENNDKSETANEDSELTAKKLQMKDNTTSTKILEFTNTSKNSDETFSYSSQNNNKIKWKPSSFVLFGIGKPVQFDTSKETMEYMSGVYRSFGTRPINDSTATYSGPDEIFETLLSDGTAYIWIFSPRYSISGIGSYKSKIAHFEKTTYRVWKLSDGTWSMTVSGGDEYIVHEKGLLSKKEFLEDINSTNMKKNTKEKVTDPITTPEQAQKYSGADFIAK